MRKLYLFSLLFLVSIISVKGQKTQTSLKQVKEGLQIVGLYNGVIVSQVRSLATDFCELNEKDLKIGDSIVFHLIKNIDNISDREFIDFSYQIVRCVSHKQKMLLREQLAVRIRPFDTHFHKLVCLYEITSFNHLLLDFSSIRELNEIIENFEKKGLTTNDLLILKNYATLAVLGDKSREEKLFRFVRDIFEISKTRFYDDPSLLTTIYTKILPSVIAMFESKSSVVNTLYMFDNEFQVDSGHGAVISFDIWYYNTIIRPKIDPNLWMYVDSRNINKVKDEVVSRIMNDDSIWLDHIKISHN